MKLFKIFKKKKKENKDHNDHRNHKNHKSQYARICPKCGSINVKIEGQGSLSGLTALGLPTSYRCLNCGYTAYTFPEVDLNELSSNELKELKQKEKNRKNREKEKIK